jgi:O-acetylserine/cysteine efflux transporter
VERLALLVPVFGMAGAVLVLGETLPAYKLAAMALILAGLLIQRYGAHFITVTSWRRPPRKV